MLTIYFFCLFPLLMEFLIDELCIFDILFYKYFFAILFTNICEALNIKIK